MPTREELADALDQCKRMPSNFENCLRLAVFDYILNRIDQEEEKEESRKFFDYESDSEFYRVAQEVEPAHLMATIDELVGCVQILDARLYQSFIQKLKGEEE
jgi:hypothetical protein